MDCLSRLPCKTWNYELVTYDHPSMVAIVFSRARVYFGAC